MDRSSIFISDKNGPGTFEYDDNLPALPLPDLRDTMQRYYESLKPFGTPEELSHSRRVIAEFENGIGAQLHAKLKERAGKMTNWLDGWWDSYAYHLLRVPLYPYTVMAMPVKLESVGAPETPENLMKNFARIIYHTIEFWELLRTEKLNPLTSNGGKIKYSSALCKHFTSTTRVPGVEMDYIEKHFRTVSEGPTPTHGIISGKGRIFMFETMYQDGALISPHDILIILQRVRSILDYEELGDCVPALTHSDRATWAKNRQRLMEISPANKDTLKLIETSNVVFMFDENEPQDYGEVTQMALNGDYHSKWADRSSIFTAYKNGKFSCSGEHSSYDGTISVHFALFILLSLFEMPEPDWKEAGTAVKVSELKFDLDDAMRQEIRNSLAQCDNMKTDIVVTHEVFTTVGKDFMKLCKLHPDSFVQVVMQLAYKRMHDKIASTYETALMRHFYNGRTETLRSCTSEVYKFLQIATRPDATKSEILKAFRLAVEHHNHSMKEARKGHGVDRHLFGLWCIAYENKINIPAFYDDPLYAKSGGGGNFVLSTSTLGYTLNVGCVAPMVLDGYGVFYTITSNAIHVLTTAFKDSEVTSVYRFVDEFGKTFSWIKSILEDHHSKL